MSKDTLNLNILQHGKPSFHPLFKQDRYLSLWHHCFFLSSDPDEPKHTPHKQQMHMLSPAKTLNQTSHPLSVVSLSPLCLPLHSLLDHPTVVCCSAGPAEEATPTPKLLSPFSLSHANTHRVKVRREYRRGPFPSISVHSPNIILNGGARFPTRYAPSLIKKKKTAQRRKTKKGRMSVGGEGVGGVIAMTTGWEEEKSACGREKKHSLWHGRIKGCPRRMLQSVTSISSSMSGLRGASAGASAGGRGGGRAIWGRVRLMM